MTDELELLKKDWQKKELDVPKLSYDEIHKMIWKKSSSIVKWILIVSILEFSIPQLLYLFPVLEESLQIYDNLGLSNFLFATSVIYYGVVFYFIYQFYIRFKEISILDDSKKLMQKIIKTRRTVKHYVIFSLATVVITITAIILGIYLNDDIIHVFPDMSDKLKDVSPEKLKISLLIAVGVLGLLLTALLGLFYFLIYGILLRKLKRNYNELKRLEI